MDTFGTPLYVEAAFAAFARALEEPTSCARCEGDSLAPAECRACVAEVVRNRADARDEIVRTVYTNFGSVHSYRPDVAL